MTKVEEICKRAYPLEIIQDPDEGGYVAYYPDLKGCITVGETAEQAVIMAEDAKRAWVEDMIERGLAIPEPEESIKFSGQLTLRVPRSLHKKLSSNAKRENVSMNQYCAYLLSSCI